MVGKIWEDKWEYKFFTYFGWDPLALAYGKSYSLLYLGYWIGAFVRLLIFVDFFIAH